MESVSYTSALRGFLQRLVENIDPEQRGNGRFKHLTALIIILLEVTDGSTVEAKMDCLKRTLAAVDPKYFGTDELAWIMDCKPPYPLLANSPNTKSMEVEIAFGPPKATQSLFNN